MVKNKSFGSVSVKLLCSIAFISLVGCTASPPSLTQPYSQLMAKKEVCFEKAKNGLRSFPDSQWLRSLTENDQKQVLSYLAQYAYNSCISEEVNKVEMSLAKQSDDIQLFFNQYVGLHEFKQEPPKGVDIPELNILQKEIKQPFIANEIYESIK